MLNAWWPGKHIRRSSGFWGVSDTSYSSFHFLPDKILLNLKKQVQ